MFGDPALAISVAACLDWARRQWPAITLQVYITGATTISITTGAD
jgi:hypothetical protein